MNGKPRIEPTNERGEKSTETENRKLDVKTIRAIEYVLSRGDRAEVIPVKDGVKVLRVKREEVKKNERAKM